MTDIEKIKHDALKAAREDRADMTGHLKEIFGHVLEASIKDGFSYKAALTFAADAAFEFEVDVRELEQ
jgi:hypothetical protein